MRGVKMTQSIEPQLLPADIAQEWLTRVSQIYATSIKEAEEETYLGPDAHPLYPSLVAVTQTKQYLATLAHGACDVDRMHIAATLGSLSIAADHLEAMIIRGVHGTQPSPRLAAMDPTRTRTLDLCARGEGSPRKSPE